jgi:hypothetical protein
MVDNQHRQIPGYRELDQTEVDLIAAIKTRERALAEYWQQVKQQCPDADSRDIRMARTHFEDGFSRLVRAVAKPDTPWGDARPW